jgi:hypothetical protein
MLDINVFDQVINNKTIVPQKGIKKGVPTCIEYPSLNLLASDYKITSFKLLDFHPTLLTHT